MGVWIETGTYRVAQHCIVVTPCVGVWIETYLFVGKTGLSQVTPCVGVWIETYEKAIEAAKKGHTLRGCVD